MTYVFARLERRASALCVNGVGADQYDDGTALVDKLERAFGELDPTFARDERLLNLRQGNLSSITSVISAWLHNTQALRDAL